jgi:hypothetical protein
MQKYIACHKYTPLFSLKPFYYSFFRFLFAFAIVDGFILLFKRIVEQAWMFLFLRVF